jgi:hypothetical protein
MDKLELLGWAGKAKGEINTIIEDTQRPLNPRELDSPDVSIGEDTVLLDKKLTIFKLLRLGRRPEEERGAVEAGELEITKLRLEELTLAADESMSPQGVLILIGNRELAVTDALNVTSSNRDDRNC